MSYLYSTAAFAFDSQVKEHVEPANICWLLNPAELLDILIPVTPSEMLISSEKNSYQTGNHKTPPGVIHLVKQVAGTSRNDC